MRRAQHYFILFLLVNLFCTNLFSQDISGNNESNSWSINLIKGKKNIVGKLQKGPFTSKEETLANWYYYGIAQNKKFGIVHNDMFVTKRPSSYFNDDYISIIQEFETNRESTIKKYGIKKDVKIEKQYLKLLKKQKKSKTNVVATNKTTPVQDEESETEQIEQTQEQLPETIPEPVEQPKEEIPAPVVIQEEIPEPEETVPEIDFSDMMDKIAKNPVQRYSREYIQDYMKAEKIPQPVDIPSEKIIVENPDETDIFGQTLLMKAARSGNDWEIKTLIDSGANVNIQDKDGWTALMYAVRYQHNLNTVNILLNANADVKIKNNYDYSALILAVCYNNNPELIKTLLNYYSISDKEVLKSFVLLLSTKQASEYVQIAKINIFLDKSIPLNNFYDGKTPLMYSARSGNSTKILQLLIDNGAKTSIRSTEGKTAFDFAVENKNLTHDEIFWSLNKK